MREKGITKKRERKVNCDINVQQVVAIIFSNIWPDNRFAANLTAKLIILDKKEIPSIRTNKGINAIGVPAGKKKLKE